MIYYGSFVLSHVYMFPGQSCLYFFLYPILEPGLDLTTSQITSTFSWKPVPNKNTDLKCY